MDILANYNPLDYVKVVADVIKALFSQWESIETVSIRFISFIETLSLNILHKN